MPIEVLSNGAWCQATVESVWDEEITVYLMREKITEDVTSAEFATRIRKSATELRPGWWATLLVLCSVLCVVCCVSQCCLTIKLMVSPRHAGVLVEVLLNGGWYSATVDEINNEAVAIFYMHTLDTEDIPTADVGARIRLAELKVDELEAGITIEVRCEGDWREAVVQSISDQAVTVFWVEAKFKEAVLLSEFTARRIRTTAGPKALAFEGLSPGCRGALGSARAVLCSCIFCFYLCACPPVVL